MTLRSLRKPRTIRWNMLGSSRRKAGAIALAALSVGGSALAVEPPTDRGAAMLKALRERDARQHWEATENLLPSSPQPLPPVIEPQFSPSASEDAGPAWRPSGAAAGRASVELSAPPRIAIQDSASPPDLYDPPVVPEPEDEADLLPDTSDRYSTEPGVRPIARTPDQLRKINEILPFYDYEPDPNVDDPCLYLCPRPDGLPCKQYGDDEFVPPCPEEVALGDEPFTPISMPPSVFAWKASNVSYNPLYFQDVQLERYGHTYGDCIQPFVSVGRFGVQLIGLPYQMALDPPCKEMYPLGYYRPGEPAPKLFYQIPLNARAAAVAAGVYTGIGVVLP